MADIQKQFQEALMSIDRVKAKRILFEALEQSSLSLTIQMTKRKILNRE